jgi:hypothetical protein
MQKNHNNALTFSGPRRTCRMLQLHLIGLLSLLTIYSSLAGYLPTNRSTEWKPGIPVDIPEISVPVINVVTEFNVPNDSSADATGALQTALDATAAAGGGVVYLPEGIYRIDGELKFNGDSIVLRGDGGYHICYRRWNCSAERA